MKLSAHTISILKSFKDINEGIEFRKGQSKIGTVGKSRTIMAFAQIEEQFPVNFAIADISGFLGCMSIFNEPEFTFHDEYVIISQGQQQIRYTFCDPAALILPAEGKDFSLKNPVATFPLKSSDIKGIIRSIGLLKLPDFSILSENGNIIVKSMNEKNKSGNEYSVIVGTTDATFNIVFDAEIIINIMERDYTVEIDKRGMAYLYNDDIAYFIAPKK